MTHDGAAYVSHVCRVAALRPDAGPTGVTAIDKRPVPGAVKVGPYGLRGDVQADRKHHGGLEKALYAFDQAEADYWAEVLGEDVPPGRFGENLRVVGGLRPAGDHDGAVRIDDAEIGERWRIGERLEVEVTGPRSPCGTFARWLKQEGWVKRFADHGRTGAYLRVVTPGAVRSGDAVVRVHVPGHGVTVTRWYTGQDPADARLLLDHEAAGGWRLADYMREPLERAARRG